MSNWGQLFAKAENSGVYPINGDDVPDVRRAAGEAGLAVLELNLAGVQGKDSFLRAAAKVLDFPSYFGENWDAFEDCLTDLSWIGAGGYLLLIECWTDFLQSSPEEMPVVRSIFEDAATFWKEQSDRFFVGLVQAPMS